MMTTLWPIFVHGIVATFLILAPAFVRAFWESLPPKTASLGDERDIDHSVEFNHQWKLLLIASSLPLSLALLLLWGAAVGQISGYGLWIPLVILLPVLGSAVFAQQLSHREMESSD